MVTSRRYSKRGAWLLFTSVAFPIHVWALVLIFRDFSWVTDRTNSWDALGVGAYGLSIALVESIFIFLIILLLGFFISQKWDEKKRISILSMLLLIASIWAIMGQLIFLLEFSLPPGWIQGLAQAAHPLRNLYALCFILVASTVLLPLWGLLKYQRLTLIFYEFIDRIALLVTLYLVLDIGSIVVVLIRNI